MRPRRVTKRKKGIGFGNLPSPLKQNIFLYAIGKFQEVMCVGLVCKDFYSQLFNSQYIWFSLSGNNLNELPGNFKAEYIKSRVNSGYFDNSLDWKAFYLNKRKELMQKSQKKKEQMVAKYIKSNTNPNIQKVIRKSNLKIVWKHKKMLKEISEMFYFKTSVSVIVKLESPCSDSGSIEITYLGKKLPLCPSKDKEVLVSGEVSLIRQGQVCVTAFSNQEIPFMIWNVHYFDFMLPMFNKKLTPKYDDLDSQFGLLNYSLLVELRTGGNSLECIYLHQVDFEIDGNWTTSLIEVNYRIPKNKLFIGWKTEAFSGKFTQTGIIDCTLRCQEGEAIWWISAPAKLKVTQRDSIKGDLLELKVVKTPGEACIYIREEQDWVIEAIEVKLLHSYISSIFVKG